MGNDRKVGFLYDDLYREIGSAGVQEAPKARKSGGGGARGRISSETKQKLARVANGAPEVMVKVSGRTTSSGHLKGHLDYITRNGTIEAETNEGPMKGKDAVNDIHANWSEDENFYKGQHQARNTALSVNIVLSMPAGVDRSAFRDAVRDFVDAEIRPRADVALAFHDDTLHPHAHVTVRGRQHSGQAFNPGKAVLAQYREKFASALRHRGIEAEATPRFVRGKTLKAERQPLRHIRAKGDLPRVEKSAIADAHKELKKGASPQKARPWEKASTERQGNVKALLSKAAQELSSSSDPKDRKLAAQLGGFVQSIPAPKFAHQLYKAALEKLASWDQYRTDEKKPDNER